MKVDKDWIGSDLALAMLKRSDEHIWCAIYDDSDEQAIKAHDNDVFTAYIVSFRNGSFYCTGGIPWLYDLPININEFIKNYVMCVIHTVTV